MTCFNLIDYRPQPEVISGYWSQFAQWPTDAQIRYHGFEDEPVDGFIAVMDCTRVGDYARITVNGSRWLKVLVFDCMGSNSDPAWWRDNNIIGEMSYGLAVRYNLVGKGGVEGRMVIF